MRTEYQPPHERIIKAVSDKPYRYALPIIQDTDWLANEASYWKQAYEDLAEATGKHPMISSFDAENIVRNAMVLTKEKTKSHVQPLSVAVLDSIKSTLTRPE